jgi:hypothetical protein
MTSSTSIPGSKVGRARRELRQLWQVPTFLLGLLAFLGVAASAPWRHTPQELAFLEIVHSLRRGLDQEFEGDWLVTQAEEALARLPRFPSRAAEVHFLAGSAYYRQGQQAPAAAAKAIWPRAVEHLEKATALGVSDADTPALQYRLGYSLYQDSADLPRALELLGQAVEKGAERPLQGYQMLVQANLGLSPPNLDGALSASRRILDLTPEREVAAIAQARLQHGELLVRKGTKADAIKELDRISLKAPHEVRIKAKLLQARCCEEDGLWSRAIPIWQDLLQDAPHVEGGRARIDYALGLCCAKMQPANEAEAVRAWAEALQLGGPAGQAAGLRLGDVRLSVNEKDAAQALADWRQALANVNEPGDFKNPLVELAEVRALFDRALQRFQEKQDAKRTEELAELYRKIAPGGVAEKQLAQAAEEYGQQLQDKNGVSDEQKQAQFRRAAAAYEQAAVVCRDAERPDLLWRSAKCAVLAKDNALALKVLHQHVLLEKNEARLAESWNHLGDLYRMQGQPAQAHTAYFKCIEYPSTSFAYRARYSLAVEAIDKKEFENARAILNQNLVGDQTDIDRPARERSLYKMAWLLMQMKNYSEARAYLKNALAEYPENAGALSSREQLGECYRQLAKVELAKQVQWEEKIKKTAAPDLRSAFEERYRGLRQDRLKLLDEAIQTYQGLADYLLRRSKERPLDANEQILERRALFGIGDCHVDTENFAEALRVFQNLQAQHRRTIEGLYACERLCLLAQVIRSSANLAEPARAQALQSIRLLMEDLNNMKEDHEAFRLRGSPTRNQWIAWAEATRTMFMAPPKAEGPLPAIR